MKHLTLILVCICLSGCSVLMALSGERDANLGAIKIGQPRQEVLLNLGQPIKTIADANGRSDYFALQKGNAPSAGRALFHGVMDVITWGGWELVGTPVEAVTSSKYSLVIKYDSKDIVTEILTGVEEKDF